MTVASNKDAIYTSKIIKAGALLPDTKVLLAHWDKSADVQANLREMRQRNVFGKASRSRIEDILLIFRHRYLSDPTLLKALVILTQQGIAAEALNRILILSNASCRPVAA